MTILSLLESETIKGWIFDLDGVITDTAELHYRAWQYMSDTEPLPFNREINEKLRGVSRRASLNIILDGRKYSEQKIQQLMTLKNDYYKKLLEDIDSTHILPGVMKLLHALKTSGKKSAIASASKNSPFIIERLGISDYFHALSTGASVIRPKPEPDVFVHAAGQLGFNVDECVVIEDAEAGVVGAKRAGFTTIGIGPEKRVGAADLRLDTTEALLLLVS